MRIRKLLIVLAFAFIIPQGISWRVWLNMWPELESIARCESNFNPAAIGDKGTSFGLFQIHLPAHPTIKKSQALDPYFSLAWAIDKFHNEKLGIWSCWKIVKNKMIDLD